MRRASPPWVQECRLEMTSATNTAWIRVDVSLRPDELVAAWRGDSGRLLLSVPQPLRIQQRVVSRITLLGLGVAGTVTGRVVSSSRSGDAHRVEVAPDETRRLALKKLLSIARGEPVDYQNREPRFLVSLPAVVQGPGGNSYRTTFSISAKGCGLAWSGPVPAVGEPLQVRLGAGSRAPTFRSVVCWTQSTPVPTVGVRFVEGPRSVWASMLTDLEGSGAPIA
jgi:hypothetical protein